MRATGSAFFDLVAVCPRIDAAVAGPTGLDFAPEALDGAAAFLALLLLVLLFLFVTTLLPNQFGVSFLRK